MEVQAAPLFLRPEMVTEEFQESKPFFGNHIEDKRARAVRAEQG